MVYESGKLPSNTWVSKIKRKNLLCKDDTFSVQYPLFMLRASPSMLTSVWIPLENLVVAQPRDLKNCCTICYWYNEVQTTKKIIQNGHHLPEYSFKVY
jgi:hypothetical protein